MRKTNQRSLFFGVLPVLLTFFLLMTIMIVQAQQRQISGTVRDAKGSPLASVTVAVKGGAVPPPSLLMMGPLLFLQKMAMYWCSVLYLSKRPK